MDVKKILIVLMVFVILLVMATVVITQIKPKMHKTILLEQIIYKRVK